jgi:hypothetical protein
VINNNIIRIGFFCAGISLAQSVWAGNYLFPTDIVPPQRFDASAGIQKSSFSQDLDGNIGVPVHLEQERRYIGQGVSLRYGLTLDWHIGIAASYRSQNDLRYETKRGSGVVAARRAIEDNGADNLQIFAKHKIHLPFDNRFSLVMNAGMDANTAANEYTAFNLGATAGWIFSDNLKGYAGYEVHLYDQDTRSDIQSLSAGLYYQVDSYLTFVPRFVGNFYDRAHIGSTTTASSRTSQSYGVAAHIKVSENTYLIPYVGIDRYSSYEDALNLHYGSTNDGRTYNLALYHAF